jgi:diguanylate cyclase (GGDEF)-like protein
MDFNYARDFQHWLDMKKNNFYRLTSEPLILNNFRRTLGEIEWLLLVLILFYLVVGKVENAEKNLIVLAACIYAVGVATFQYWNFFKEARQWKIALQSWVMIVFISWVIWYTGKLQSPLFNLYLLPVLSSAIALGKLVTLLQVGLIFSIFLYLSNNFHQNSMDVLFSMAGSSDVLMLFFPMLLVGYISTMLTSDIQSGFNTLKIESEIDELTKLFNYRTFNSISKKLLNQAKRFNWKVSVLMIDVDNLKATNDQYGHEIGNLLLTNIAQCLVSVLRDGDIAARYGGDEFVVFLTNCEQNDGVKIAERIVNEFQSSQVRYHGEYIKLSASIGIANFPEHGDNMEVLLGKADKAMYFSKHQGRCLTTVYTQKLDD